MPILLFETDATWNSLEICKLIVSAATPIAVALLGWWLSTYLKRIEQLQWANQKAIEKRLEIFSELAPILNDLYCYFSYIGDLKHKSPEEIISLKRKADRMFYVNAPLFSSNLKNKYEEFIKTCFVPKKPGESDSITVLKTDIEVRKKLFTPKDNAEWNSVWDSHFPTNPDGVSPPENVLQKYMILMNFFVRELGVGLENRK